MKERVCYVYWIKYKWHTDLTSQGYIGISFNPSLRLISHRKFSKKIKGQHPLYNALKNPSDTVEMITLCAGSRFYCFEMESRLRPNPNIGWNVLAGGYDTTGGRLKFDYSDQRVRERISHSVKLAYLKDPTLVERCGKRNAGKTLTAEHKAKISSSAKGNGSKWKNATAIKEQWAKADICYNLFLQNVQQTQMSKETQLPVSFCQSLIKHFRSGWNPLNDADWLSTFN